VSTEPVTDPATRVARVAEIDALRDERARLAASLVADLATYEQMISTHDLGISPPPCGFRPNDHRHDRGTVGDRIFWRLASVDTDAGVVRFNHVCGPDHYAGGNGPFDRNLTVPIMFFTHPNQWLTLTALAGEPAV
jgi:hypothetical protein